MIAALIKILNMSIAGSVVILLALVIRRVFRRAPKWLFMLLWGLAALRLVLPFSIESRIGLMPKEMVSLNDPGEKQADATAAPVSALESRLPALTASPTLNAETTPAPTVKATEAPVSATATAPARTEEARSTVKPAAVPASTDRGGGFPWLTAAAYLWLAGVIAMAAYSAVSLILLKRKLGTAVKEGGVYESEFVKTPFLIGVFKPRIYVPSGLSGESLGHVVAHERAHLSALDNIWKPLGFAVLALHWFNPLCHIAYALFSRDLELACDERATRGFSAAERADYCETLLAFAAPRRGLYACPLAFGGAGKSETKERVKNMLNNKKAGLWLTVLAVICAASLCGCFLTGREKSKEDETMKEIPEEAFELFDMIMEPDAALALAKERGVLVMENGRVTSGKESWAWFWDKAQRGEPARILTAHYSTLDPARCSEEYYEANKDKYPMLFFALITYDGESFDYEAKDCKTGETDSHSVYKYLKHFTGDRATDEYVTHYDHYVLVNDDTVTWERLEHGMFSSELGQYIPFVWAYMDIASEPNGSAEPGGESVPDNWVCYGEFSGCLVWLKRYDKQIDGDWMADIGGYRFYSSVDIQIDVEKDGRFYDLDYAYENGYITETDLAEISRIHREYMEGIYGEGLYDEWDEETPAPTAAPEPTASPELVEDVARWPIDLDGDGTNEYFCVQLTNLVYDFVSFAWVEDAAGDRIGNEFNCGTGTVAQNTFALVESPEYGSCLMRLLPEYEGELYGYELWRIENGGLKSVFSETVFNYDDEGVQGIPDRETLSAYEERVNALLETGRIFITTDGYGAVKKELYLMESGKRLNLAVYDRFAVISAAGNAGNGLEQNRAALEAHGITVVDEPLGYRFHAEPLGWTRALTFPEKRGLRMFFVLPSGFTLREVVNADENRLQLYVAPGEGAYFYDKDDNHVGCLAVDWHYFEGGDELEEAIMFASMGHWEMLPKERFEEVESRTGCRAWVTVSVGVELEEGKPMAECEHFLCDAVFVFNPETCASLRFAFEKGLLTDEQLMELAAGAFVK